jgi:hypothetical protein
MLTYFPLVDTEGMVTVAETMWGEGRYEADRSESASL